MRENRARTGDLLESGVLAAEFAGQHYAQEPFLFECRHHFMWEAAFAVHLRSVLGRDLGRNIACALDDRESGF